MGRLVGLLSDSRNVTVVSMLMKKWSRADVDAMLRDATPVTKEQLRRAHVSSGGGDFFLGMGVCARVRLALRGLHSPFMAAF